MWFSFSKESQLVDQEPCMLKETCARRAGAAAEGHGRRRRHGAGRGAPLGQILGAAPVAAVVAPPYATLLRHRHQDRSVVHREEVAAAGLFAQGDRGTPLEPLMSGTHSGPSRNLLQILMWGVLMLLGLFNHWVPSNKQAWYSHHLALTRIFPVTRTD